VVIGPPGGIECHSAILRADDESRAAEMHAFVADLKVVAELLRSA
jgi:hypothetical protein